MQHTPVNEMARTRAWATIGACALTLPWLNPFAGGPSPSVEPMLMGAACTGLALLLFGPRTLAGSVTAYLIAFGALLAWACTGLTPELLASWQALLVMAACAAIGARSRSNPVFLQAIAWAWLAAALMSAGMAILQYLGWAQSLHPLISHSADGTPYANLRQRNQLATLTSIGLMALVWLDQQTARAAAAGTPESRLPALWMVALLAGVNALTASRAGMAQVALLAVLAWLWRGSISARARRLVWFAVPAYCVSALAMPWLKGFVDGNVFDRMAAQAFGCASRTTLWSNVWDLIVLRPWAGWGWRELAWAHYQTHFDQRFCLILDNAHNLPLHLAVELGLPAALLVSGALLWALWRGKPWAETDPARQLAWGVLLVIGLHSLVEYPLWYSPFQMAAGLGAGLLLAPQVASPAGSRTNAAAAIAGWRLVALFLIVSSAWALGEYQRVGQIYLPYEQRSPAYRQDTLRRIGSSMLFDNQLRFAELSTMPLTEANAPVLRALAQRMLHYSPEPRVIEILIESASLMGDLNAALAEAQRYRDAFPEDYARWNSQRKTDSGASR